LQKLRIDTSQKLSEALIVHPYHTAIVGGDSLVLERNDYRARIAYVDYDGKKVFQNYKNKNPKTSSEKSAFVESNASKVVSGIKMIERFFDDVEKKAKLDQFGKTSTNA
jgi:aspartate aminotransferase